MGWVGSKSAAKAVLPRVIPAEWKAVDPLIPGFEGYAFRRIDGLVCVISVEHQEDAPGDKWLHVSLSRSNRIPSYEDVCEVKNIFIGIDKTALQIFPPKDQHVNHHPFALHLWCCLSKDIVPDFRREGSL